MERHRHKFDWSYWYCSCLTLGIGSLNGKKQEVNGNCIKEYEEHCKAMLSLFRRCVSIEEARMQIASNKYETISFRPISKSEMIREEFSCTPTENPPRDCTPLYKMTRGDPSIVRSTFERNGLKFTDSNTWNVLWTNSHPKAFHYEGLSPYQKVNHLPGSSEVTRKDRLCANVVMQQLKHGKEEFDIIPDTYMLPEEFADFYEHYYRLKEKGEANVWIVKPNALSRGRGIYLIREPNEISVDDFCIVSRYVHNPLLINSFKFDIRLYVVVTSVDPLRIYVYNEGLARFCTEKFDLNAKDNKFSHLTNYSINKKNEKFVANKEATEDDRGQKWSVTALNRFLERHAVDAAQVWTRIYDLIIRALIACEPALYANYRKTAVYRANCFELFGFDVLLDEQLHPWLMEVNLTPSLACDAALDHLVKSNMVADMFTLVGLRKFDRKDDGQRTKLLPNKAPANDEFRKSPSYLKIAQMQQRHKELIIDSLEEYERRRNFIRIYPAKGTDYYDKFLESSRNSHKVLYKFLYEDPLQINKQEHIVYKPRDKINLKRLKNSRARSEKCVEKEAAKIEERVVIEGNDVLIEYVERLVVMLKMVDEVKAEWAKAIDAFVNHSVWQAETIKDESQFPLWQKLNMRLVIMKESKKTLNSTNSDQAQNEQTKELVGRKLEAGNLEAMLRQCTDDVLGKVVACLVPPLEPGILSRLLNHLAKSNGNLCAQERLGGSRGCHKNLHGTTYYSGNLHLRPLKSSERIHYPIKNQKGYTNSFIRLKRNSTKSIDSPYSNTIPIKDQSNDYMLPEIKNLSFAN